MRARIKEAAAVHTAYWDVRTVLKTGTMLYLVPLYLWYYNALVCNGVPQYLTLEGRNSPLHTYLENAIVYTPNASRVCCWIISSCPSLNCMCRKGKNLRRIKY